MEAVRGGLLQGVGIGPGVTAVATPDQDEGARRQDQRGGRGGEPECRRPEPVGDLGLRGDGVAVQQHWVARGLGDQEVAVQGAPAARLLDVAGQAGL